MALPDLKDLTVKELDALQTELANARQIRRANDLKQLKADVLALLAAGGFSPGELVALLVPKPTKTSTPAVVPVVPSDTSEVPVAPANTRAKAVIKYRQGDNEWTGRGQNPKWVRDHIAAGGKKEDLAI